MSSSTALRLGELESVARTSLPGGVRGNVFSQLAFWPKRGSPALRRDTRRALSCLRATITALKRAGSNKQSPVHLAYSVALVAELRRLEKVLVAQVERVRGLR